MCARLFLKYFSESVNRNKNPVAAELRGGMIYRLSIMNLTNCDLNLVLVGSLAQGLFFYLVRKLHPFLREFDNPQLILLLLF